MTQPDEDGEQNLSLCSGLSISFRTRVFFRASHGYSKCCNQGVWIHA
jgi:hypothetical protein